MLKITRVMSLVHTLALCWNCAMADVLPGQLALQSGDYEQARAEVEAALAASDDPVLRLMQARISIAENQLDDAQQIIERVLQSESDNAQANTLKGQLLAIKASRASLFQTGKFIREALSAYEAALKQQPEHVEALTGMIRLRSSAPALFGGSFKQALATAERLHGIDPVVAGLETAAIYRAKSDDKQHVEILDQLTRSHPSDPRAWLELGFVEQRKRNWQPANEHFVAALTAAKDHREHTITAQSARYQIGRTAVLSKSKAHLGINALSDYLDGPRFSELPDFHWAHYRRGLLHVQMQHDDKAERDFELAGHTDDKDLKRALSSF